jgi:FkbM family methyltransferase
MHKLSGGAWLPEDELDPVMLRAGSRYQSQKLEKAISYCLQKRTAIDVGAHCGLWTNQLLAHFERVEAFEPLEIHQAAWYRNVRPLAATLYPFALGEKKGSCSIELVAGYSGRSHISGDGEIPVQPLDGFRFQNIDLIKADVEGFELFVLKGAEETLLKWKPVVVVEQKANLGERYGLSDKAAVEYLQSLGAVLKEEIAGDFILSW